MNNPIPTTVRGWLYVVGIIVGGSIAIVLPDLLAALDVGPAWTTFATRLAGALTLLLATLSRANLGNGDNDLTRPNPMHDPNDGPTA